MTRRDAHLLGKTVVKLPNGAMQGLLYGIDRIGYNSGVYGWNWDAHLIHEVVFCNGYRNLPGYITTDERALVAHYEEKAMEVWMKDYCYNTASSMVYELLCELAEKIKAGRA